MTKIGIAGYGTIGELLAYGIASQQDLELVGVADQEPNLSILALKERGYPYALFNTQRESKPQFDKAGVALSGSFTDLISEVDIMVDTNPAELSKENFLMYQRNRKKAIFQGGRENAACDNLFHSYANYEKMLGKQFLKLPTGMITGLSRSIFCLDNEIGVEQVAFNSLARKGWRAVARDSFHLNFPSQPYIADFSELFPSISALGVQYTTTFIPGEVLTVVATTTKTVNTEDVQAIFHADSRIRLVKYQDGFTGIDSLLHYIRHTGALHSTMYEIVIWEELISISEKKIMFTAYLPFLSILVPESIDAIRAATSLQKNHRDGITRTNEYLGMGEWK